jgi:UDP-glucose 4-epimerase
MEKKKILVTGGTGYIGSHTIIDLIEHGYEPISIDNGVNSSADVLDQVKNITGHSVKHYDVDLCDFTATQKVFSEHNFDGIIHFAALKAVGESVQQPIRYFKNNVDSLLNVLQCALEYQVPNFIFSSSCTVYGNVETSPVTEDTPMQEAASPYGRTKQIGEQVIQDSLKTSNTKAILLRYFNPAGAHPSGLMGEAPSNAAQNLVPVITETAIGKRASMTVYGSDYDTRDGSCVRDYIHIMDLAHAHTLALEYLLAGKQDQQVDVYNLGIGEGITVFEIIKAFEKTSGVKLAYEVGPRRDGDVVSIFANYAKAKKNLGWTPEYGVEEIMDTAWIWEKNRTKK